MLRKSLRYVGPFSYKRFNSSPPKTRYITTPIFYVNARPHLGHLYSLLLADTRNRWEILKKYNKTYFLTGTDDHGLKVQEAAEKEGLLPKQLTDRESTNFKILAQKFNIDYDRFIRTTDEDHIKTVQYFWNIIRDKGLIYRGSHKGWYATSDEAFYPENQIEEVVDPVTKRTKMISKETKNEVSLQEEINYFFKLSQFRTHLIEYFEKNEDFIIPRQKYREMLNELKSGELNDLSISRPTTRLHWGIDVPGDPSQKIYVWFDALINYLTACGFPEKFISSEGTKSKDNTMWPATHVIGKDIMRFHCVYWPTFLMAVDVELPKQIVVHSHWLSDGFKMSKSLGNVVDPIDVMDYYGEDCLRFFLLEHSNIESDCNYSEKDLYFTRENLIGKYANLLSRCGSPSFSISDSIKYYADGEFTDVDAKILTESLDKENAGTLLSHRDKLIMETERLYESMDFYIKRFDHMAAIQSWWRTIETANQFLQLSQPWLYTKAIKNNSDHEKVLSYKCLQNYYVFLSSEVSRICSILILPIMPSLATKLLDRLAVSQNSRSFPFAVIGSDLSYGVTSNSRAHKLPIERVPMRGVV